MLFCHRGTSRMICFAPSDLGSPLLHWLLLLILFWVFSFFSLTSYWSASGTVLAISTPLLEVLVQSHGFKQLHVLSMCKFISFAQYPIFELLYLGSSPGCLIDISSATCAKETLDLPPTNLPYSHLSQSSNCLVHKLLSSLISFRISYPHPKHQQIL